MKQALVVVEEINRYKRAIRKSTSVSAIMKYHRKIRELTRELKFYCSYKKDVSFEEVMSKIDKD